LREAVLRRLLFDQVSSRFTPKRFDTEAKQKTRQLIHQWRIDDRK